MFGIHIVEIDPIRCGEIVLDRRPAGTFTGIVATCGEPEVSRTDNEMTFEDAISMLPMIAEWAFILRLLNGHSLRLPRNGSRCLGPFEDVEGAKPASIRTSGSGRLGSHCCVERVVGDEAAGALRLVGLKFAEPPA